MSLYNTILEKGKAEQTIKKSKFIATVAPVESREEAIDFIDSVKKTYKDAKHNVPIMIIGDKKQVQWASDNGEPQGTAGAPILKMAVEENLTNIAIVVTRYFGGIKLGTGGLVRAYTGTAKLALEDAKKCSVEKCKIIEYNINYTFLSKFQNMEKEGLYTIVDLAYTDTVNITVSMLESNETLVREVFREVTSGEALIKSEKNSKIRIKIG